MAEQRSHSTFKLGHAPAVHHAPVHHAPTYHTPSYKQPAYHAPSYKEPTYKEQPAAYSYGYDVQDDYAGVNFGQNEARDGYATNGKYYVLLPDGRTQTVTYSVDGYSGYVADVQYSGYAQEYHPAPSYKPVHKPAYHG